MTRLFFLFLFQGIISSSVGQNYIEYYNLCNLADKDIYQDNYVKALEKFEQAFKLVDYIHAKQLEKASQCAIKNNEYAKATVFIKKAILNGSIKQFWNKRKFRDYYQSNEFQMIKDSISYFEKKHLQSVNLDYKKQIDSLHYIDQKVVRKAKFVKGNYNIDKSKLPKNRYDLDQPIFQELLRLIEKNGFPSEKNIGPQGYDNVWVIFHHNVRLPQNDQYISMVKQAVLNGEYLPHDFAWMYDQGRLNKAEAPLFYYGVPLPKELSGEQIKKIDEARAAYGLKPFESVKVKTKGNRTVTKMLW